MDNPAESIVGVLDLLDGQVVRAIGGNRRRYRPWRSQLANSSDPLEIANAFRQYHHITHLYIADLNALGGEAISHGIVEELVRADFHVTLDAGPCDASEIDSALATGANTVVIPLETLPHRSKLLGWRQRFGSDRLAFGLDLRDGIPMAESHVWDTPEAGVADTVNPSNAGQSAWESEAPWHIARDVIAMGISRLIVLDVHTVGRGSGPTTGELCGQIRRHAPSAIIWTGGGVRDPRDVADLRAAGADRVLVATALHGGNLETPPIQ